jgi:hypothetical protein
LTEHRTYLISLQTEGSEEVTMELPVELFDEITGASNLPTADGGSAEDRRQHRRLPFGSRGAMAAFRNGAEGPPSVVLLRDISIGGIGFLNAEPMKPGDAFVLRFSGKQGPTIKVKCLTQRCDAGGTGGTQYIIGATFEELLETTATPTKPNDAAPQAPVEVKPVGPRFRSLFKQAGADEAKPPEPTAPAAVAAPAAVVTPAVAEAPADVVAPAVAEAPAAPQVVEPVPVPSEPAVLPAVENLSETKTDEVKAEVIPPAPVEEPKIVTEPTPPAVESLPVVAVETKVEETPVVVATPVVEATPEVIVPAPVVVAEVVQPEIVPTVAAIRPRAAQPVAAIRPRAAQPVAASNARNQEILAQVRARVLKQGQTLQSQVHQLDETTRQLAEQKAANADLARQRDHLQALFVKAGQELSETRSKSATEVDAIKNELASLKAMVQILQAKSDADDQAIAELAGLLGADSGLASMTQQAAEAVASEPTQTEGDAAKMRARLASA